MGIKAYIMVTQGWNIIILIIIEYSLIFYLILLYNSNKVYVGPTHYMFHVPSSSSSFFSGDWIWASHWTKFLALFIYLFILRQGLTKLLSYLNWVWAWDSLASASHRCMWLLCPAPPRFLNLSLMYLISFYFTATFYVISSKLPSKSWIHFSVVSNLWNLSSFFPLVFFSARQSI